MALMRNEPYRKPDAASIALITVVFSGMFLLSMLTPLIADDYNYTMGYATGTRIGSLMDIWRSMAWHRQMLNGRVFAHGWVSLVLMYPRWVFAILNGAVAVVFTWTTIRFFGEHGVHPVRAAGCAWMMTWICMPGFGQIFLWTSGSCNYFWGFTLAWVLICRLLRHKEDGPGIKETLFLLLPAFAAGAWSEHISFAMLMIIFLHTVGKWIRVKKAFPGDICLILAGGAGYLYLMLAPASKLAQRLHDAGDPTEEGNLSRLLSSVPGGIPTLLLVILAAVLFYLILRKATGINQCRRILSAGAAIVSGCAAVFFAVRMYRASGIIGMISSAAVGFFISLCIFFTILFLALKRQSEKERILLGMNLFFSGMCAFLMFLFGEYLPPRAFCAPVLLAILASVLLAEGLERTRIRERACLIALSVVFVMTFIIGITDIISVYRASVIREKGFREAAEGNLTLITSPYPCKSKYSAQYANADLEPDADWPNGIMADYYGIKRIIVEAHD